MVTKGSIQRRNITLGIVALCLVFAIADYSWNDYGSYLSRTTTTIASSDVPVNDVRPVSPTISSDDALLAPVTPTITESKSHLNIILESATTMGVDISQVSSSQMLAKLVSVEAIPFILAEETYALTYKEKSFIIHELKAEPQKAMLAYQGLQDVIATLEAPNYDMNPTNSYGDRSFYINDASRSGTAFLVVLNKQKDAVYMFQYDKSLHSTIERIIDLL